VLLVVVLDRSGGQEASGATAQPPVSQAEWESATVGIFGRSRLGETTACDTLLTQGTLGIAHPVLLCGVDLVVSYRGHEVRNGGDRAGGNVGPRVSSILSTGARRRPRDREADDDPLAFRAVGATGCRAAERPVR
jgi:hypothetical protein